MTNEFQQAVIIGVGMLAEAFTRKATPPMIKAYQIGLNGLAPQQVERACAVALRSCKFMPSPAELREFSGELRMSDRAERAWIALSDAVTRHGAYKSVTFDDTVINATVLSIGGWIAVCETEVKEFDTFLRNRFLKAYESLARTGVNGQACRPLPGRYEIENATNGYTPDSDRVKALNGTVYLGQLVAIETGLPALPNAPRLTSDRRSDDQPRIEFKKP